MSEELATFAMTMLWSTGLILPLLVHYLGTPKGFRGLAALKAICAIALGWAYTIAYAVAAQAISSYPIAFSDGEPKQTGDGASFTFSVIFGWVIPTILVVIAMIIDKLVQLARQRNRR